ncbi:MAG: type I phosphomannose isomerase catalytic subunit [Nitrospirota bacterium]
MKAISTNQPALYPLRFEPIYQYRLWGGRRLAHFLTAPLPGDGPIGEAWLLSDREDHASVVADGPLKGRTLGQLLKQFPELMMGRLSGGFRRFPLLLKLLDARDTLSVQVHPSDIQTNCIPLGETGKTEAWVVLEVGAEARIYAGLKPHNSPDDLWRALKSGTVADHIASFRPEAGESVLIPAGTVHSLGDVVVFEVQENSDVTFRLFDWNHVDAKTGQPRPLQVDRAMACLDFSQVAIGPVSPIVDEVKPVFLERILACKHFEVCRFRGDAPFEVGASRTPQVLVCLAGDGHVEYEGDEYALRQGDVMLLPAEIGTCLCQPRGVVTLLEIFFPEGLSNP